MYVDFRLIAYLRCYIASHIDAGCTHLESSLRNTVDMSRMRMMNQYLPPYEAVV